MRMSKDIDIILFLVRLICVVIYKQNYINPANEVDCGLISLVPGIKSFHRLTLFSETMMHIVYIFTM